MKRAHCTPPRPGEELSESRLELWSCFTCQRNISPDFAIVFHLQRMEVQEPLLLSCILRDRRCWCVCREQDQSDWSQSETPSSALCSSETPSSALSSSETPLSALCSSKTPSSALCSSETPSSALQVPRRWNRQVLMLLSS